MISGATGALAVVMVALVAQHGVEYLFATVVLMGLMQIVAAGIMRWGKFIRLVPHPVMLGFRQRAGDRDLSGAARSVQSARQHGKYRPRHGRRRMAVRSGAVDDAGAGGADHGDHLGDAAPDADHVPAPLAGIAAWWPGLVIAIGLDVPRVGDLASIQGGLPSPFTFPWSR